MFVNKINNISFNGFQHSVGNAGEHLYKFNYPHDNNQDVRIEFYRANSKQNEKPIKTIKLSETNTVCFDEIPELKSGEAVKYKVFVNGRAVADTGYYTGDRGSGNGYNMIYRNGTNPLVQGQAILTVIDSHRPGASYADFASDKTGSIDYNIEKQKAAERVIRTFSNKGGGSLAGIQYDLPLLKSIGVKKVFMTPVWGGDNRSSSRYWNKNDMHISDELGNIDNYETFIRALFKNGMQYVDDFAVTSEGLEGVHIQYILRWANQNPQMQYLFKMSGIKDAPLTLGIVPKNMENLRHRVVNPTVLYNPDTKKIEKNPDYDSRKETYFQVYDASQVTEEQLKNTNELIGNYQKLETEDKLAINISDDTVVNYAFEIKPEEYENRLKKLVEINKGSETPIELNSPDGTLFIGQFTHFKIGTSAEGAVFWDANKDLFKRNYFISGYDEKLLNAIPNIKERDEIRELMKRANCEARDMAVQASVYRTQVVKDSQLIYAAQMLQGADSKEAIDKLIGTVLPKEAQLNEEEIENIKDGWYELAPKLVENRDDYTLKSIMKLPLDSLELGDNTVGVLSSPFFSKRASNKEGIGISRYEFNKQGAGVYSPYHKTYHNVDGLFENQIREFVDDVINKVNETSKEKLLDENKKYTEYGEYVVDLLGKEIAKYALLKAIAGDKLQTKVMPDDVSKGKITYDYQELKKSTTLEALGINASSPEEEAKALYNIILNGLEGLTNNDVDYVANAISKRIEGTTINSFRLAEAMVNKAGLGLDFRLDAAKDVADMDAVRNGDITFDQAWDDVIDFWKKIVQEIKKVNPNAYIVAEITDIDQLMRAQYGKNADVWNADLSKIGGKYKNVPDAIRKFFEETGITSEAAYSYTFTDLLHVFSADAEFGNVPKDGMSGFVDRIKTLINSNNIDYIRNAWTFADNHDKPSVIHSMALDMELFHTTNLEADFQGDLKSYLSNEYEIRRRNARISVLKELTNSDKFEDMPLEAMMNIDNKAYFRIASTRSTAMSQLLRAAMPKLEESGVDTTELKNALVDLTNGNYLNKNKNFDAQTIKIPQLQTIEGALNSIMSRAGVTGLSLSDADKDAIVKKAKEQTRVEKFAVRGDFDWKTIEGNTHWAAQELENRAMSILESSDNLMQYSPYTISVASLILDAAKEVLTDAQNTALKSGAKSFVKEFNREKVNSNSDKLPITEDNKTAMNKKAYASRDVETVIEMIMQQAEFKTGKKFTKEQHDLILKTLFIESTQSAVEKALMYASFLSALPGIPSQYYRDVLGALGYDEKSKNVFLQNRNTVPYSELEADGPLKEYRTAIFNAFREVMQIRSAKGLEAINTGSPYMLDAGNKNVCAMMYQGEGDDVAISIMNGDGINPKNIADYTTADGKTTNIPQTKEVELENIALPAMLALPVGTAFVDYMAKDGSSSPKYIINKLKDGGYGLVREDGAKIKLNGETAKHGAMFLKKIVFRGKNINKQYNFATNPYQKTDVQNIGERLSIVAR